MNFDFATYDWRDWTAFAALCLGAAAFLCQMFYYIVYYGSFLRHKKRVAKGKIAFNFKPQPVSVIICAHNEAENLQKNLKLILAQRYPSFEVIVVNDGSTDQTNDLLSAYEHEYPNFYHTFLPENAKFISRKKMALSVGIRAAKNDILLFTDADCAPTSDQWIANMVRNFDDRADIVLGYGAYRQGSGFLSRMISYDSFFGLLQYWGFALHGVPYMGVGRNLAYRKSFFEKNKGFSAIMNIQSGDDDLFVEKTADSLNTRIEVSEKSIITSEPKATFYQWYSQKWRRLSTMPFYRKNTKIRLATEVASRLLFYAALILLLIFGDMYFRIAAGSLFLVRLATQLIVINRSAARLNERKFHVNLILFDIFIPLVNICILTIGQRYRQHGYKWK